MGVDYTAMWESLGLDIKAHDGLLQVLGQAYRDVYLSQQNRPRGMGYFDFVISGIQGAYVVEMARGYRADGVVHYALQFCTPYAVEAAKIEKTLAAQGIPLLRVETDYGMEDVPQLETRVQAFLEMLHA